MTKARLRTTLREQRQARPVEVRTSLAAPLAHRAMSELPLTPARVTCYRSLPTEPDTRVLLDLLFANGHAVWLPRIDGASLRWVRADATSAYARGPLGIAEPEGPSDDDALTNADVLLMPGLACDLDGHRLGQGGGYYDRALAHIPSHAEGGPLRILLLHDDEVIDQVPVDDHDQAVDVVVTASRVIRFT